MSLFTKLLSISFLLLFCCSPKTDQSQDSTTVADTTAVTSAAEEMGVTGDFDGDGITEKVLARVLNTADDEFDYSIEFSNAKFPAIEVSPMVQDGFVVLNEGDLDQKPGDEISIILCNINNDGTLRVYAFKDKDWKEITEPVNVDCSVPYKIDLDDVVTKTDSGYFAMDFVNDDSLVHQRKEIIFASASGDFDGDGASENVYIKTLHDAGLDDSGYWEYKIEFSNTKFAPLTFENHDAGGCDVQNKGNTDGKSGDELSVTSYGTMGRVTDKIYRFDGKKWELLSTEEGSRLNDSEK